MPLREDGEQGAGAAYTHCIAICTANRPLVAGLGARNVASTLSRPAQTRLLIVNNGAVADTPILAAEVASIANGGVAAVDIIHEPKPGLAHARNAAVAVCTQDILTFFDDDTCPVSDSWQDTVVDILRTRPNTAVVGGPVIPRPPDGFNANPRWRSDTTDRVFSAVGGATGPCRATGVVGGNMSYRRSVLGEQPFDGRLGWNASRTFSFAGEETLFHMQLDRSGYEAWFDQHLAVMHRIEPARYNMRWVLRRLFSMGRTSALFDSAVHHIEIRRIRVRAARGVAKGLLRLMGGVLRASVSRAFAGVGEVVWSAGALVAPAREIEDAAQAFLVVSSR